MRHPIGVRVKGHPERFKMIKRVLRGEVIGNFNPLFCIFQKEKRLVKSSFGDLSDPFRRTEDYLTQLYIEI